ncbi:DNA-binding response regulator [Desulfuribacillus stibiiarsenatis]|uniref:DNA-binding response regulator n=1 Tax=Desulfuribacillus stibiiarsenatis TaxID=1390249 RepID=A0A1E5L243_9FIRM|nr:response regulator transcription factor [Desulfuribacillus stibiiarsenatis]OEH84190.1 DNA-binding response regulator [Desulfuribacillus stibiiarsenatis]
MTAKILLVDDHELVRLGLKTLIEKESDLVVVGEAADGNEAIQKYMELRPDITLMDIRMPNKNGIEACREIRDQCNAAKVLMVTSHADDDAMFSSIMAGAVGYIKKEIGSNELVSSIRKALDGSPLIDPVTTQKLIEKVKQNTLHEQLTEQEREILSLIGEGKTNKEIALVLCLGEKTVRNYVSNIFSKLNFTNRSQAAVYAVRKNMFDNI